jgi:hypothetical protein
MDFPDHAERAFLIRYLPIYYTAYRRGRPGRENLAREAVLEEIYFDLTGAYPDRLSEISFPRIGFGGAPAERKKRFKRVREEMFYWHSYLSLTCIVQRIRQWMDRTMRIYGDGAALN